LSPPFLELPASHHTVLHGEQRHQKDVHDDRFRHRHDRAGVYGLGHRYAADEADGVEKSDEKYDIGHDPIEKCDEPADWIPLYVMTDCLGLGHGLLRSDAITGIAISPGCEGTEGTGKRLCPDLELSV